MVSRLASQRDASKGLGIAAELAMALHGSGDLGEVLDELRRLLQAESAMLVRAQSDQSEKYIALSDAGAGRVWHEPARSCVRAVFACDSARLRAGAIWRLTEAQHDSVGCDRTRLSGFLESYDLREVVVLALENQGSLSDYLELHYRKPPAQHNLDFAILLAGTLATCWRRRLTGVITRQLIRTRLREVPGPSKTEAPAILDISNPAQLSRCEYRICALLNEGMTVNVIAVNLSIGQATVRSHLSSIFAKTGTSSQVELLHLLNRKPTKTGPTTPNLSATPGRAAL